MNAATMDPKKKEELKKQEQAELESSAKTAHPAKKVGHQGTSKHVQKAGEGGKGKAGGKGHPDAEKVKKKAEDQKGEERTKLPSDIVKQFKDADLTDVTVVKNSSEAKAKKVQGFATRDIIYIAPGVDEKKVMQHEAAHVVQFRKGAETKQHDSKEKNEAAANQAESGGDVKAKDLGTAPPDATRHKDEHEGSGSPNANDHGAPNCQFNGMELTGISGHWAKRIEPEGDVWERGIDLWHVGTFWPIPALPIAGLDISSTGNVRPTAELSAEGGYSWNREEKCFALEGTLGASIGGQISASVLGGLAVGFVGARVGVGLEARGMLALTARAEKRIALKYYYERHAVAVDFTPLELSLTAQLKLDLSLAAFAHSWFGDSIARWTFASFNIASWEAKWPITIEFATDGITTRADPVTESRLAWGSPPHPEGHGHE